MDSVPGPAYTIRTPRLLLRCFQPADAPAYGEALAASAGHLRPWLPWVKDEPRPLDEQLSRMRSFRALFDMGRDFSYGVFDPDGALLGAAGLHPRVGADAREASFWTTAAAAGHGLATEGTAALARVAFEVDGVRRLEAHCDPRNRASIRIAERLGFVHEATLRARDLDEDGTPADTMIWSLFREGYEASPAASAAVEAFDAMDRRLL
jgi:RimJ/RimL family protein N-acetyltransferase